MGLRVGVDVGGTFTDFLVADEDGSAEIYKTSTTPQDPSVGFFRGLEKAAEARGVSLGEFLTGIDTIVHGTTITTNATLTGDGAKVGFITTKGFRDVLNLRRGLKERQFEKYEPPAPLIPRERILVVDERVGPDGDIITPLDETDVIEAADAFRAMGVEAVAVSLLWSFRNPVHEERIGELLAEHLPGIYVSLSTEILPQIRVYERNSTTALNSYVGPVLTRYLSKLKRELGEHRYGGKLLIMQSNGGVLSPQVAERFASNTLLSGPAGAPMAGIYYGATHGLRNVITVDMGGTSFDVALVKDAKPAVTSEGTIGGYHIASPILDIHTIGAGGGSIAWVNSGGLLAVGPKSAGAEPGPALYGRGGDQPTVTDAQYVLGYLDPSHFEQGELNVDGDAAEAAIRDRIAGPLNMDLIEAADGIFQVVNHSMAAALEAVSVRRGYDPREFALIVAGGAGPIHAAAIARELEIPLLLIPRESSVFCAAGMLISDLKHDYVRTFATAMDNADVTEINRLFQDMTDRATETLREEGVNRASIARGADLRYVGQFNEVEIPFDGSDALTPDDLEAITAKFHRQHDALYGYAMPGAEVELINLRVTGTGETTKPELTRQPPGAEDSEHARIGERRAYFRREFHQVPVYDGLALASGNRLDGPAIVVQPTTTIVVPPDFELRCDEFGNYLMVRRGADVEQLIADLR